MKRKMTDIVLCLDIDDCILPSDNTYFGQTDDSLEILALNMKRIKLMIEKFDMQVFITSAWYSTLFITDDNVLGYKREENAKTRTDDFLAHEYEAFKMIRDGIGNRALGLSCGSRYKDIASLLLADKAVIAMDDMDLSESQIKPLCKALDDETFNKNYLFTEVRGFITNTHSYQIHCFMKNLET